MADPPTPVPPVNETSEIALYCPACMYDLRGLRGDQCPECGAAVDRTQLERSSIHWVHREGLGLGAFLKTALRATFKTEFFCLEIARPVALTDARKFRRRVVGLLWIVLSLCALVITIVGSEDGGTAAMHWEYNKLLSVAVGLGGVGLLGLFLMGLTGLHMVWFHPKALPIEQQNRAVALSHYACASLLMMVPVALGIASSVVAEYLAEQYDIQALSLISLLIGIPSGIGVILTVVSFLFVCARMAQHTCNPSVLVRLFLWLALPIFWLIWGVLIFAVLPMIAVYLYMIVGTI